MPTYQYACTDDGCGNRFELVQSFTDPSATECPVCAGPVRKVYSSVGVVFKGSGFYRTDSRAAATASAEKAANGGSDAAGGKPEAGKKPESSSSSSSSDSSPSSSSSSSDSKPAATSAAGASKAAASP